MPLVRGATGGVRLRGGEIELPSGSRLSLKDVNVDAVLSWLAACAARKIVEETGVAPLEVRFDAYVDLDKLLDGTEEIEYLVVVAVYAASAEDKKPRKDEVLKAVLKCPVIALFKEKIKGVLIESRREA